MTATISKRGDNTKVTGEYYVTYKAERFGKKYTTIHLQPSGSNNISGITADQLNEQWDKVYKGFSPFNGDPNFEVVKIQQRIKN